MQAIYAKFAHGTFASLSSLKGLPLLILLTILAWSAEAGRLYFVMQALDVHLGPLAALFTVAAISLALIVPTPGGLGGVEAAFAGVLAVFGVPLQIALAVALLDRLISYYSLILFGLPRLPPHQAGRWGEWLTSPPSGAPPPGPARRGRPLPQDLRPHPRPVVKIAVERAGRARRPWIQPARMSRSLHGRAPTAGVGVTRSLLKAWHSSPPPPPADPPLGRPPPRPAPRDWPRTRAPPASPSRSGG